MLAFSEKKRWKVLWTGRVGKEREIGRERKHLTGLIPKEIER